MIEALWDVRLREHYCDDQWTAGHYDETSKNCYDFALGFLRLMGIEDGVNRERFIIEKVLPKTKQVARYVVLYRKVTADGCYILQSTSL
jgi:hypothetical protein